MRLLLLSIFLISFCDKIKSQQVYTVSPTAEAERIGKYFLFYEDEAGTFNPATATSFENFKPTTAEVPNFNVTSSTIWGLAKLTCSEKADWYLCLEPAMYNQLSLFQKKRNGPWQEVKTGNAFPNEQRQIITNHFLFKLNVDPRDTTWVLLKIHDYYPIQIDCKVAPLRSFLNPFHKGDLYLGICYGIMLMMILYNLYLFLSQKKRIYIYYVLYVFFSLLFSASLNGNFLHFPWPLKQIINFAPLFAPIGFGVFSLLFTLDLFREVLPKKLKVCMYLFMPAGGLCVILSMTQYKYAAENILQVMGMLLGILSLWGGLVALKKKHSSARFYLAGFGAYMLSLIYLILSAQNIFPINGFTFYALLTGSAVECIMLSFALGDKLKIFQAEKEKAQEEALQHAEENARLIKEQNAVLEHKVKERTAELTEKNKEILDSIHYASRIQRSLLPTEMYITKVLKKKN